MLLVMTFAQSLVDDLSENFGDNLKGTPSSQKSNALSNKLSSVLSASYADSEFRDALQTLDEKSIKNTAETRRRLRLDVQKEVIERNSDIIKDFGHVTEVRSPVYVSRYRH